MKKYIQVCQGQKCKVYRAGVTVGYGEVIGLGEDAKILLLWRPDFKDMRVSEFDRFLEVDKVRFISNALHK